MDAVKQKMIDTIPLGKAGRRQADGGASFTGRQQALCQHRPRQQVFTIDTATNKVAGSVEVGPRPWGIALSPDGKTLYSANGPSNDISVVDVATNTVIKKINAGYEPLGCPRSPALKC